jgi:hypothetical protein
MSVTSSSIRPDSLVNEVVVIVQPNPSEPSPTGQTVVDANSQTLYGIQAIVIDNSLLATNQDAQLLAQYLVRPEPNFWFTGLGIEMHALTDAQRDTVAQLDIGSLVTVRKSFKFGTPSNVEKRLFIEGIEHTLTPRGHVVQLYFSPVGFQQEWQEVTPALQWQDVQSGLSWTNLIYTNI